MTNDIDAFRARFRIFGHRTYLNSCSYGALSDEVRAAVEDYLQRRDDKGSDWNDWVSRLEIFRAKLAEFLGCDGDEVAITGSVSESVNALASALEFTGKRRGVVLTDFDFPTTSQIFLSQQRRGAIIRRAQTDKTGSHIPIDEFERLIDDETLLVSIPLVCYRNGATNDVEAIIKLAHSRGALVLVDGYQGVGAIPVNVKEMGADFLVGGSLKYLIGTAGVGYMYVNAAAHPSLDPVFTGWFAQEDIGAMNIYEHKPSPTARRFESGTPNVCGMHAAAAGVSVLMEAGAEPIWARIRALNSEIAMRVRDEGWSLASPSDPQRQGPMMAIRCANAPELVQRLDAANITVSDRDGNLRVSTHFYNNSEDLDRLFEALGDNRSLIG
ncbi:MAG: aminotransferase class V-fold PLP-dependent enzyme [Parvularculaceae bacterium]